MTQPDELPLRSIRQVAEHLNCSIKTVRRWIVSGELTAFKIGRQWRVAPRDLHRFLHERWNG